MFITVAVAVVQDMQVQRKHKADKVAAVLAALLTRAAAQQEQMEQ
jgi:hypothetical protein